jgi:hypothetical protein
VRNMRMMRQVAGVGVDEGRYAARGGGGNERVEDLVAASQRTQRQSTLEGQGGNGV